MRSQVLCIFIQMRVQRKTKLMSMVSYWLLILLCRMVIGYCLEIITCMWFSSLDRNYLQVLWIMKRQWRKQLMISLKVFEMRILRRKCETSIISKRNNLKEKKMSLRSDSVLIRRSWMGIGRVLKMRLIDEIKL